MRRDLRKLLARLRVGLVRPAALQEAVEDARASLVSARFERPSQFLETSIYARVFLERFEREVAQAQMAALEGDHLRAVRGIEEAERLLGAAHRMAEAHRLWDDCRRTWKQLGDRPGFEALRELLTIRMAAASLASAEMFLARGQPRQALFAAGLCRGSLERVLVRIPDDERRRFLVRKLIRLQGSPGGPLATLSSVLGRLIDEGHLELAERLIDDSEIHTGRSESEGGHPRSRRCHETLAQLSDVEKEAQGLAGTLAELVPAEKGSQETQGG